jgi:2-amino-4-hydroxy-6-hydroxymethyldihydropteridine diphosphokinase
VGERRVRAYVGLGANVGDPPATLAWAVGALAALPGVRVRGVSPLYVTAPWGVTDQPDFHNAVVALDVPAGADPAAGAVALLGLLKMLERDAGRRPGRRWGPRELDLDLLVFGRHRVDVERPPEARSNDAEGDPEKAARRLEVPHRDAGERLFVLAPLADLAPRLVPPGWDKTVETRRGQLAAAEPPHAVRLTGRWDGARSRWKPTAASRPPAPTIERADRASTTGPEHEDGGPS